MKIIVATLKEWNIKKAEWLGQHLDETEVLIVSSKEELTYARVRDYSPDYVFFPHWSYIIPNDIYDNFNCIVFHMTDLPYGRGGSPLQNLIVRGHKDTVISAIKVTEGIDEGPIYCKYPLELCGSATEIFERAACIIFEKMIPQIINEKLKPYNQVGEPVVFKRRKPSESEIKSDFEINEIYDYIRMLDAEGYPKAFIDYGKYKLEFANALMNGDEIEAKVTFKRGDE